MTRPAARRSPAGPRAFGALLLALLLLLAGAPASAQAPRPARDTTLHSAEQGARAWLAHLDAGAYERAWSDVVAAMRGSTTYAEWTTSLDQLRSVLPHGPGRTLLRAEHGVPLFGGDSVLLTFAVRGTGLREIVVLVRDRTRWRVGGYGILL